MMCTSCGSSAVHLVDGDWSDDAHATEHYECVHCGAEATYHLYKDDRPNQLTGPLTTSSDQP